jgi:hypothetical protein
LSLVGTSRMDCSSARQHLSAFHDGELQPDIQAAVAKHLDGCPECARRLAEFQEVSRTTAELPTPRVPADIWPQIETKLATDVPGQQASLNHFIRRKRTWIGFATAALVFVAASTAAIVWLQQAEHEHSHVAVNFGSYLDEFEHNPDAAQQVLLSNYEGRAVSYDEAATKVRYQPVTPAVLPNGLSREAVYLLRMPCCTCVQAIYQGAGGEKLAVFEHADDQPVWFGTRSTIHARCNGIPCSLVEIDDHLAASWKRNGRYVTVIGARDLEQVAELVAYLDEQNSDILPAPRGKGFGGG